MRFSILIFFLACQLYGNTAQFLQQINTANAIGVSAVTTEDAFLKVHLDENKLYLNIPSTLLKTPMLFVRHNDGNKVVDMQVIWTKRNDQLLLETTQIESLAGVIIPLKNNPNYTTNTLRAFSIINEKSDDKNIVIEVADLFLTDELDWDASSKEFIKKDLSYIKEVLNLKNEAIIKTEWVVQDKQGLISKTVDFSFYLLPKPMIPRLYDYRMGFATEDNTDGISNKTISSIASIRRWRLVKKDTTKKISLPIQPIIFTLSPEIPEKWRSYIKAGILEWLLAFEAAGFKNAIEVLEPTDENFITTKFSSVNHSVVRWGPRRNKRGFEVSGGGTVTHVIDKRSGEILKSDILLPSSLQRLSDDYIVRCASIDNRALQYPLPDDLMGSLIQFVTAHEAGHSFGLMDGHYGEYAYPFEKMRDKDWLQNMGHTPSVMTYARQNYLVQPEDSIPPSLLIQKVGPTDNYNIRWAYTVFNEARTPVQERNLLEAIIKEQDSIPWFRYVKGEYEIIGPAATNEVVDNNDPIKSTALGLKNLERVIGLLSEINQDKKDFELVQRLYVNALLLWRDQMRHVLSLVGGYAIQYKSAKQEGNLYTPISIKVQNAAMDFFLMNAFNPPKWLSSPKVMNRIKYSSYPDELGKYQLLLLLEHLSQRRMKRLENMEDIEGFKGISTSFAKKTRKEIFKELENANVIISPRRQELQSMFLDFLIVKIFNDDISSGIGDKNVNIYTNYAKSIFTSELLSLHEIIEKKIGKIKDEATLGHLQLCLLKLNEVVE